MPLTLSNVNIKTYTNNTGSGNTINAFGISGTIDQNFTWSQSVCGFPYVLIGATTLTANHTLTIPAGEVIKSLGRIITINGTLNAIGTTSQNIVFTSLYDDAYGGDLNGDGNATTPAKGNWSVYLLYGAELPNRESGIWIIAKCCMPGLVINMRSLILIPMKDTLPTD